MIGFTDTLLDHLQQLRSAPMSVATRQATQMFVGDSIAVAIAGAATPESRSLQLLWAGQGEPAATVWGSQLRAPRDAAAMLNAFAIHNQEFDCVHEPAVVHPMAVVLAALLTDCDARGRGDGEALLRAVVIAVESAALIGRCSRTPMRFFRPGMCGALGASAGLAFLRGLDETQTRHCMALACSQLSGTMQAHVEGLPTLALQIAWNARAALTAADLAGAGLTGPHDFLEGRFGYFALIEGEAPGSWDNEDALAAMAGATRAIEEVSHKPFPTGRAAHGALDMLAELITDEGVSADAMECIELRAPPLIHRLVGRPLIQPLTASYARLCLPWLLSTCLKRGSVGLGDFSAEALADPTRCAHAARIRLLPNDVDDPNALVPQHLRVQMRDGRVLERSRDAVLGAPALRLNPAQQQAKFAHCLDHAGAAFDPDARERLRGLLDSIESLSDLRPLCAATRPPGADAPQ
jgi:aconitate decarboxylase